MPSTETNSRPYCSRHRIKLLKKWQCQPSTLAAEQPVGMRLDGLVTFASGRPQPFQVEDANVPPAVPDQAGLLQRVGDDRHAGAPHAHHLGDELLGEREIIAALQIPRAQQPPRETGLDRVGRVARGRLLRLHQNDLLMPEQRGTCSYAGIRQCTKSFGSERGSGPGYLNNGLADRNLAVQAG